MYVYVFVRTGGCQAFQGVGREYDRGQAAGKGFVLLPGPESAEAENRRCNAGRAAFKCFLNSCDSKPANPLAFKDLRTLS